MIDSNSYGFGEDRCVIAPCQIMQHSHLKQILTSIRPVIAVPVLSRAIAW